MIDEETGADGGSGVDVYACFMMGVFGYYAWDDRNLEFEKFMGQAKDRGCQQTRVAENNLVWTSRRRIARQRSPNIFGQQGGDMRKPLNERIGYAVTELLAVGAGQDIATAVVAYGHADLFNDHFVEGRGFLAEKILQV